MIDSAFIKDNLDKLIPNPRCELDYEKDYELLLATVLSAQCTDKRVNEVTKKLFKYTLKEINDLDIKEIEKIIKPLGTYQRKAYFVKEIANRLIKDCNEVVPNNRSYLEKLPGVGRKTANVVLANLFNEKVIAVDTHVARVSKRLGISDFDDDVYKIEEKLMKFFDQDDLPRLHHQLLLFGRYYCKSQNPQCENCFFQSFCKR